MLVRTRLGLAVMALGITAILCASLLIWSTRKSEENQTRITLAYESLSGYLQLSGLVFRTFKQARRDILSGDGVFAFDFDEAEQETRDILTKIKIISTAEDAIERDAASAHHADLTRELEREIHTAFDDIRTSAALVREGDVEAGRERAAGILETRIDGTVSGLIEKAIATERGQLDQSSAEITFLNQWSRRIALLSGVLSVGLTAFIFLTLVRRVSRGLIALESGAHHFSQDNLDHVIDVPGQDEFALLAGQFNEMAERIRSKHIDLEASRLELEGRVKDRTAELSAANDKLQERDNLRRQFFADIGHELRTPVTAIRGEAEVALRTKAEAEEAHRSALRTIVTISEQLTELVSDIFLIAREQAGVLDLRTNRLDLGSVVKRAIDQMSSLTDDNLAVVSKDIIAEPIWIEGDESRLSQLTRVLLSNALTHSQAGVKIDVQVGMDSRHALLKVSDNGPGIPIQERERVFQRYVRVIKDQGRPSAGTGLGLPIAWSITHAHGGWIEAGDSDTGGTRIVVCLPLAPKDAAL
jgi:signal transduction histidine kinase